MADATPTAREITIALLTAGQRSAGAAEKYLVDVVSEMDDDSEVRQVLARVAGQLVTIVNSLRQVPAWEPFLDQFIRDLALSGREEK